MAVNLKIILPVAIFALVIGVGGSYIALVSPTVNEKNLIETELTQKNAIIANLTETNQELSQTLTSKDIQIQTYTTQKNESENLLETYTSTITELETTINDLSQENTAILTQLNEANSTPIEDPMDLDKVLVTFNNIYLELPKDYVFYYSGLYDPEPNNLSGVFIGSTNYSRTTFSFSWTKSTNNADLNQTLNDMYDLIDLRVKQQGTRENTTINDYNILYEVHRIESNNIQTYVGYAAWYDLNNEYSLILAMEDTNTIRGSDLLDFISTYRYNPEEQ